MIEVRSLCRSFGGFRALDDVSFTVAQGEIVGFLGPNGAGKTTTMRILTGFLPATSGTCRVAGFDVFDTPMEVKRRVGYLPESPPLYPELTIGDYLRFVAELRGFAGAEARRRVGAVMERVGLKGWERRILGSLSKGYRQRVGLAQALVHDPQVLILDEPTSGLDPTQLPAIRDLIRDLAGTHTVVLSTHILQEVEAMCPRALIIARGKLLAEGSLDHLRGLAKDGTTWLVEADGVEARELGALDGVDVVEPLGAVDGFQSFRLRGRTDPRTAVAEHVRARGGRLRALAVQRPSLEQAFIDIVGRES